MISTSEVARRMEVSNREVAQLAAAGLLGESVHEANRVMFDQTTVDRLVHRYRRSVETPLLPAFVIRVGPKKEVSERNRKFIGYAVCYGTEDDDETRKAALCRWWPAATPERLKGLPLIATLAGLVVAHYRIDDFERSEEGGRVSFVVSDLKGADRARYANRRLRLTAGPIAMAVGLDG